MASTSHAYARFDGSTLTVGNALVERTWQWRDGRLWATGFLDKSTGRQWLLAEATVASMQPAGTARMPSRPPVFRTLQQAGPVEAPSLVAELVAGGRLMRFTIFDNSLGVTMQLLTPSPGTPGEGGGEGSAPTSRLARGSTRPSPNPLPAYRARASEVTGVEATPTAITVDEQLKGSGPFILQSSDGSADTIDAFRPAATHLTFTAVTLVDQTDAHDNLVFERQHHLTTSERPVHASGNVFFLEDPLTGDGLVTLKLAPLPHARPIGCEHDAIAHHAGVRYTGHCAGDDGEGYALVTLASTGGTFGRIAAIQKHQRQLRPYVSGRDGLFLSNTWGDRNRDGRINESFMQQELAAGERLGVDVVQIDDGWQKGRSANSIEKGGVWNGFWASDEQFWSFHPQRFPNGIAPLAEAHGLPSVGLWFAPDSSNDFSNWERDATRILELHRAHNVTHFKIDGVKMHSRPGEQNLRKLFDRCLTESQGKIVFDLDVTAETRPAYFGLPSVGPIFVENRYTDWHKYWPHHTLRNLWQLAHYVDPLRLRMEFLNNTRHADKYAGDPLAPTRYAADYLFASVMFASPLGWFENSSLPADFVDKARPLIAAWKARRDQHFTGTIYPIGQSPTGSSWTGFASLDSTGRGLVIVFRELTKSTSYDCDLPTDLAGKRLTLLAGRGQAENVGDRLRVTIDAPLDFAWFEIA